MGIDSKICGLQFADTKNETIMFFTESSLSLYSVSQNKIKATRKLKATDSDFVATVLHASANPEVGAIAVILQTINRGTLGTSIVVWPNGRIQLEEPLKIQLSVGAELPHDRKLNACVFLSRTDQSRPQTIIMQNPCGRIAWWRLNAGRSQLEAEEILIESGRVNSMIALDDECTWVAQNDLEVGQVQILHLMEARTSTWCEIIKLPRTPIHMAISNCSTAPRTSIPMPNTCNLALCEPSLEGGVPRPIQVLQINALTAEFQVLYQISQ